MTDFIRTIWQNANGVNQTTPVANPHVKTEVQPVDQIHVPSTAVALADDDNDMFPHSRVIKMEVLEPSTPATQTTTPTSADAGKAQRAARRDVVNARRDKRKAMSPSADANATTTPSTTPTATSAATTPVAGTEDGNDKLKKMKTGKSTCVTVTPTTTTPTTAKSTKKQTTPVSSVAQMLMLSAELDPLGEERLRAMEAQLDHLDPDSKEAKKKRRLIRNRMSAQLHRERKKAYVGQLEDQLLEKEREVQRLQEQLAAMASESSQLKKQLDAAAAVTAPAVVVPPPVRADDVVVIKQEPVAVNEPVIGGSVIETISTETAPMSISDNWEHCLNGLDDEMATDDLLCDFDHPFSSVYAAMDTQYPDVMNKHEHESQTHHEIHAAKKNLAMMMAVMFSVTFFGNSPFYFNLTSGSNFSSMFNANPPKEFSQMSIASRIVACLEKSSWKDFRDIASWTTSGASGATAEEEVTEDKMDEPAATTVVSPSASDITDSSGSCDSPDQIILPDSDCLSGFETDLIDDFVYPVDDPFAPALADTNWLAQDDFGQSDVDEDDDMTGELNALKNATTEVAAADKQSVQHSMTSRVYQRLTKLWQEKNQVLLTVLNGKNEVTQRSVADMSSIRKGMESGNFFAPASTFDGLPKNKTTALSEDQSVTFLYPLSAFNNADKGTKPVNSAPASGSDVMFLEVSCAMNNAVKKM